MKWFFICMLAANLALLGWNWQHAGEYGRSESGEGAALPSGPRLVLLGEADAVLASRKGGVAMAPPPPPSPPAVAEAEPAAAMTTSAPDVVSSAEERAAVALRCVRLRSLESQAAAASVITALQQGGATVRGQGEEAGEIKRYWVMLPPGASAAAATPVLERLQRAGIKDFYLIRSGENMNAISLGVFSSKDAAQNRLQQIRELKLAPRIEEITLPAKRWWVEFNWPATERDTVWRSLLPRSTRDVLAAACR